MSNVLPCASWLPVICQNPAAVTLTWQGLRGRVGPISISRCSLRAVFIASVVVTSIIIGVRHTGMLQRLELQAFDQLQRLRSDEGPDPRLLVVTVTEADIQAQKNNGRYRIAHWRNCLTN